jgi:hypothetical protein
MTARASANCHRPDPPHATTDWTRLQYQPTGAPLLTCARCGAKWIDDDPGRQAHITVFGHSPKPAEPASPAKETTP